MLEQLLILRVSMENGKSHKTKKTSFMEDLKNYLALL